jgi:hypothetical protein
LLPYEKIETMQEHGEEAMRFLGLM